MSPAGGEKVDVDWKAVGAIGAVIAGLAVLHGLTSKRWKDAHTLGVVLGLIAAAALHVVDQ
jgi:hypothetical protein